MKTISPPAWPILFSIIFCGFILRFWGLASNPPALNWDEVSQGYNAYSILKTGKDEWGVSLPLIFRAFGDYKLPLYTYLTVIPIALLGLNSLAVRLISVVAGTLAILLIYLLTNQLFPKKTFIIFNLRLNFGLLTAGLLAINPWHFFISRPALEANLALTLVLAGALFLLKALNNSKYLIPAAVCLGLSLHTYNSARIFAPLLLVSWIYCFKPKLKINLSSLLAAAIFILSLSLVVYQLKTGEAIARYNKLSILSETAVFQIGQDRLKSQLPFFLPRLVHNRPVYWATHFLPKYFSYFSPTFFQQSIGAHYQFAIPKTNILTLPGLLLFYLGSIFLLKNTPHQSAKFILIWLLLGPIPASATIDPSHALRTSIMIPAIIITSALGLSFLAKKTKIFTPIILSLTLAFFISYYATYWHHYRQTYSDSWQYGYKEAIQYIKDNSNKYSKVVFTKRLGEPHIFYAFFNQLDPNKVWPNDSNIRFSQSGWFWTDKIDNVYFVNDWDIPQQTEMKTIALESGKKIDTVNSLLITSPDHLPVNATVLEQVNFLNSTPAFVITHLR